MWCFQCQSVLPYCKHQQLLLTQVPMRLSPCSHSLTLSHTLLFRALASHTVYCLTRSHTRRSSCWVGAQPRHLLDTYTTKHSHWVTQLMPQQLTTQPHQQQQQQQLETATAAAPAGGASDANISASRSALHDYVIAVEDATEPASNSPTGFNCRATLRVYPVAAIAAAAAASGSGAGQWWRVLGCGNEEEGLVLLENLSGCVDTEAGYGAGRAHVEVQEGQLVVVADSGGSPCARMMSLQRRLLSMLESGGCWGCSISTRLCLNPGSCCF